MKNIIINNVKTNYYITQEGQIFNQKTKKFLQGYLNNNGYRSVLLTVNGIKKNYSIHRLVAETFIDNPFNKPIVNHIDGNKDNNNINNLEWTTQSENRQHAIQTKISKLAEGKREKIEEINIEEWRQYKDTNYYVSRDGKVWNKKTKILLKENPNASGYIRYTLRINGQSFSKQAHILVMEAWGETKVASGQVINHKDGNKTNNHINNLEIVSKRENMLHACYSLNKNIKPVIKLIDNIEYPSLSEAARQNDVTPGAISYAIKNDSKCCGSYWKYK